MPFFGCCRRPEKYVLLWEFNANKEPFIHLHKGSEIFLKKSAKQWPQWPWAVTAKTKDDQGLVNPAYIVPKKEYEGDKKGVYHSKWFAGDLNPVEGMMKMLDKGNVGEFLVVAPREYRLVADNWLEYLLLVRVETEKGGNESGSGGGGFVQEGLEPAATDGAPPVLAFRIRRTQNGEYEVVEGRTQKNLYCLIEDLIQNGIPENRGGRNLKLIGPSRCLDPDGYQALIPPPPTEPTAVKMFDREMSPADDVKPKKIERKNLKKSKEPIGEGTFGVVFRGAWTKKNKSQLNVALKLIKDSTTQNSTDVNEEIRVMGKLQNKYLVRLCGLCKEPGHPMMIVTEFMENGQLDSFLRSRDVEGKRLPLRGLLEILYQVSCGMGYMEEERVVHRDLAARNVLVSSRSDWTATVKISDFGMSRMVPAGEYYKSKMHKLPWKWMPLESIYQKVFSSKSDIWSFGIVIYEVMTHGGKPYGELSNKQVISLLEDGRRLKQDPSIPDFLWKLCMDCWEAEPNSRPSFVQVIQFFNNLLFNHLSRNEVSP